ncbi:MAG: GtrA family protein [Pseudoclavibacter sp.]
MKALIKFALVGVVNTLVYYALYRLFLLVAPYLLAHVAAWFLSFVGSFFLNCYFTYRVRPTWKRFLRFPASALVNVAFSTAVSFLLVSVLDGDPRWATLIAGILAIPVTFVIARWALAEKTDISPDEVTRPPSGENE